MPNTAPRANTSRSSNMVESPYLLADDRCIPQPQDFMRPPDKPDWNTDLVLPQSHRHTTLRLSSGSVCSRVRAPCFFGKYTDVGPPCRCAGLLFQSKPMQVGQARRPHSLSDVRKNDSPQSHTSSNIRRMVLGYNLARSSGGSSPTTIAWPNRRPMLYDRSEYFGCLSDSRFDSAAASLTIRASSSAESLYLARRESTGKP